jgi:hypothetical protein
MLIAIKNMSGVAKADATIRKTIEYYHLGRWFQKALIATTSTIELGNCNTILMQAQECLDYGDTNTILLQNKNKDNNNHFSSRFEMGKLGGTDANYAVLIIWIYMDFIKLPIVLYLYPKYKRFVMLNGQCQCEITDREKKNDLPKLSDEAVVTFLSMTADIFYKVNKSQHASFAPKEQMIILC